MHRITDIVKRIVANLLFSLLYILQWKKGTVYANLDATLNTGDSCKCNPQIVYLKTLRNLSRHVSDILFEFGIYKKLPKSLADYPCNVPGKQFEIADGSKAALEKMRGGGIFLTAHYGNYEAIGPWLCRLGIPLKASYIPLKPTWLNRIVERRIRAVDGKRYSVNARTPREFLRILDEKNLFCLLMDQDSRIASAAKGTFMGREVHVNPLPDFLLKHRPETPVFICWMEEKGQCKKLHAIEVEREKEFRTKSGTTNNEAMQPGMTVSGTFNRWLGDRIDEDPTLWYGWTHRRFYSCDAEMYKK